MTKKKTVLSQCFIIPLMFSALLYTACGQVAPTIDPGDIVSPSSPSEAGDITLQITGMTPTGGGQPVNTNVQVNFNNAIDDTTVVEENTVNVTIDGTPQGAASYITVPGSNYITISGLALSYGNVVNITLTAGIEDAENGVALSNPGTYSFTVEAAPDSTAPGISTTTPAAAAVNVLLTSTIQVVFNENIDTSTVNRNTFYLEDLEDGSIIQGAITPTGFTTFTLIPEYLLADRNDNVTDDYTIHLTSGIKDMAGNSFAGATIDFDIENTDPYAGNPDILTFDALISGTSASVNWSYSEPADYILGWGTTTSYGTAIDGTDVFRSNHQTTLALAANTRYYARLLNSDYKDSVNNTGISTREIMFNTETTETTGNIDNGASNQSRLRLVSQGGTGLFAVVTDDTSGNTRLQGQLYNSALTAQWGASAIDLFSGAAVNYAFISGIEDGSSGLIILSSVGGTGLYTKRISSAGAFINWGATADQATDNGLVIDANGLNGSAVPVGTGLNSVLYVWRDPDAVPPLTPPFTAPTIDILVKDKGNGTTTVTETTIDTGTNPKTIFDGTDKAIVVYESANRIYAHRVTDAGIREWGAEDPMLPLSIRGRAFHDGTLDLSGGANLVAASTTGSINTTNGIDLAVADSGAGSVDLSTGVDLAPADSGTGSVDFSTGVDLALADSGAGSIDLSTGVDLAPADSGLSTVSLASGISIAYHEGLANLSLGHDWNNWPNEGRFYISVNGGTNTAIILDADCNNLTDVLNHINGKFTSASLAVVAYDAGGGTVGFKTTGTGASQSITLTNGYQFLVYTDALNELGMSEGTYNGSGWNTFPETFTIDAYNDGIPYSNVAITLDADCASAAAVAAEINSAIGTTSLNGILEAYASGNFVGIRSVGNFGSNDYFVLSAGSPTNALATLGLAAGTSHYGYSWGTLAYNQTFSITIHRNGATTGPTLVTVNTNAIDAASAATAFNNAFTVASVTAIQAYASGNNVRLRTTSNFGSNDYFVLTAGSPDALATVGLTAGTNYYGGSWGSVNQSFYVNLAPDGTPDGAIEVTLDMDATNATEVADAINNAFTDAFVTGVQAYVDGTRVRIHTTSNYGSNDYFVLTAGTPNALTTLGYTAGTNHYGGSWGTVNQSFVINVTQSGTSSGDRTVTLNTDCTTQAAVIAEINASLTAATVTNVEAYAPDATHVQLRSTVNFGSNDNFVIGAGGTALATLGLTAGTYSGQSWGTINQSFIINVNGAGNRTVTLNSNCTNTAQTVAEINAEWANAMNGAIPAPVTGVEAYDAGAGLVGIRTTSRGSAQTFTLSAGAPNALTTLGLTAGTYNGNGWTTTPRTFSINVNGTGAQTITLNTDSFNLADVITEVNAGLAAAGITLVEAYDAGSNHVGIRSLSTGHTQSIVLAAGAPNDALATFGMTAATYTGTSPTASSNATAKTIVSIKSDDAGGVVILYKQANNLYAQHIDNTGATGWGADGYTVESDTFSTYDEDMVYESANNGVIVAARTGNNHIWMRRVGTVTWTAAQTYISKRIDTGTASSTAANMLIDTGPPAATWTSFPYFVRVGDIVYNTTTTTQATVTAVNATQLTLSADIFPVAGQVYEIYSAETGSQRYPHIYVTGASVQVYWEDNRFAATSLGYGLFGMQLNLNDGSINALWHNSNDYLGRALVLQSENKWQLNSGATTYNGGTEFFLGFEDYRAGAGSDLLYINY